MATTKELFKERMTIRKTDPLRAGVLGMIIDSVQKAIRELDRDETPEDIQKDEKKMYDQTFATIQEYKKQILTLEKQAQNYQKQYSALNDLISLFIQTTR